MASLVLKINYRRHRNGTVSCVMSTGAHVDGTLYAGDLSMPEQQFELFVKTLEVGIMALKNVTQLELNEVLENEESKL